MCGIFGVNVGKNTNITRELLIKTINNLFKLSESRGKEAAGMAMLDTNIHVYKQSTSASQMLKTPKFQHILTTALDNACHLNKIDKLFSLIGHSRLVTNGLQTNNDNNQPVVSNGLVGIHNGIVVNVDDLWAKHPELDKKTDVDSEVLFSLISHYYKQTNDIILAVQKTFDEIEGAASFVNYFNDDKYMLLATNTGSLYYIYDQQTSLFIFASEAHILESIKTQLPQSRSVKIMQMKPFHGSLLNTDTFALTKFNFKKHNTVLAPKETIKSKRIIKDLSNDAEAALREIKRCSCCILPETMPFIRFDDNGKCNYCHNYQPAIKHGLDALQERIAPFRKNNGEPDCILAFSGGRDSSYGLHYIKEELKMNPITFTYDWGMVTDLARRNQARMCGKLGVEHILISADIKKKRANIQKNVKAWLKQPALGTVPIFMAGDKQYISYPNELTKKTNTEIVFYCRNQMEKTNFKTGFCGVNEAGKWYYEISQTDKIKIISYYLKEYLTNWSYINTSLLDSLAGLYHSFFVDRSNYIQLFNYIAWDEDEITSTLKDEYNWEFATDTDSSWRIGDGTAAFYNYIYYTVAGFSEIDTFRSNQVREGIITRDQALKMSRIENQPRYESLIEYSRVIGFDIDNALGIINSMPKLYMKDTELSV